VKIGTTHIDDESHVIHDPYSMRVSMTDENRWRFHSQPTRPPKRPGARADQGAHGRSRPRPVSPAPFPRAQAQTVYHLVTRPVSDRSTSYPALALTGYMWVQANVSPPSISPFIFSLCLCWSEHHDMRFARVKYGVARYGRSGARSAGSAGASGRDGR